MAFVLWFTVPFIAMAALPEAIDAWDWDGTLFRYLLFMAVLTFTAIVAGKDAWEGDSYIPDDLLLLGVFIAGVLIKTFCAPIAHLAIWMFTDGNSRFPSHFYATSFGWWGGLFTAIVRAIM